MINSKELCNKITSIYPDIGTCGIDINVNFNEAEKAWVVDLKKNNHQLKTYLELKEAEQCMEGKQCFSLGIQVAQLVENIKTL